MQKRRYTRLADQKRESISRGLAQHISIRQLAKELNRSPSTISREIRRNKGKSGYRAFSASRRTKAAASSRKRGKRKIEKQEGLLSYVMEKLQREWSPQEISKRLKIEYAWDMNMQVSHEAIYQYIYLLPRGELKQLLIKGLRQERKHRRPQKRGDTAETRGKIANMLSIEERPAEVAERSVPGHWEGDLILGKYKHSALGTLVERTTRYTILVPLGEHKDAASVREAYAEAFKSLPAELKKSLTYDQVDELYNLVYRKIVQNMITNPEVIDLSNQVFWVIHNLERTADRVTNICERILFIATGELVEMDTTDDELEEG
jgi:IS30 family transposase